MHHTICFAVSMLLGSAVPIHPAHALSTHRTHSPSQPLAESPHDLSFSDSPYSLLLKSYGPHVDLADPRGWPLKIHSITSDPYKFWRGTKDIFFLWSKTHCADWMNHPENLLPIHGDLHLGNIGTYATSPLGQLGFGLVDFDDSANLPYQLELLQGAITYQLIAQTNNITLDPQQSQQLIQTLLDAYLSARQDPQDALRQIKDRPEVQKLLIRSDRPYQRVIDQLTEGQKFKPLIPDSGPITNILDPLTPELRKAFASALQQLASQHPTLADLIGPADAFSILDAVRRTRVGSSGSQGLLKILLLVQGADQVERIIYFKQQIPSAAERVRLVDPLPNTPASSPALRSANHTQSLTDPDPLLALPCEVNGLSYVVNLYEPWSNELDHDDIKTYTQLLNSAQLWGQATGRAHRLASANDTPNPANIDALRNLLADRSNAYLSHNLAQFEGLKSDHAAKTARAAALDYLAKLRPSTHGN